MTRNEIRIFILKNAMDEIRRCLDATKDSHWRQGLSYEVAGRIQYASSQAQYKIVAWEPSRWMKRGLTDAEKMAFSRELARMQDDGLIMRIGDHGRTVEIRLLEGYTS
jgi:hypothetical protein